MKRGWAGSPIIGRKETWSSSIKSEEDHAFSVACLQNSKLPPPPVIPSAYTAIMALSLLFLLLSVWQQVDALHIVASSRMFGGGGVLIKF
jgi:hypothetical protein